MTDKLSFPGQVSVNKIELVNFEGTRIDIRSIVGELELFEDIFSNTMSGFLVVNDASGVFEEFPLIGEEKLFIDINTPTFDNIINKKFYVYSVTKRQMNDKKRMQTYMVNFISYESIISQNTRISEAFSGKITDSVIDIFLRPEYLASDAKIYIDDPINDYKFIANYWSPFETINWLARRSISKDKATNYLFFESNQSYEFVSASALMKADPIFSYVYSDVNSETVFGTGVSPEKGLSFVKSVHQDVAFDYIRRMQNGMLASQLNNLDLTFKKILTNVTDYISDFNKIPHLEKYPLHSSNVIAKKNSSKSFVISTAARYGENNNDQKHKDWYLQNSSQIEQLHAFKLIIEVPGNTAIKAGSVVDFQMQQFKQATAKEIQDIVNKTMSGKFLVSAIRHKIIADDHKMFIEITKDSLKTPVTGNRI